MMFTNRSRYPAAGPALLGAGFLALAPCVVGAPIWIEGEQPAQHTLKRHPWWYDQVKRDALSGGDWISHFSDEGPGEISYAFEVPETDTYTFWLRANPTKSSLSYRLDDGAWAPVDFSGDVRGRTNIAADNQPDLRYIAWVRAGSMRLEAGAHTLTFRMDSEASNHGAIDCFTLVRIPFAPSGVRRPTAGDAPAGPADWFPVAFGDDPLSAQSVTDVSRLVEAPAGRYGFLSASGKDLHFEHGDGPIRFWGVGANLGNKTPAQMKQAARWFRKHGINLVRQHTVIEDVGLLNHEGRFDPEKLDRYDRWFAELKEAGIYTAWSVIYPHHGAFLRASDGYPPDRFLALDAADEHRDGRTGPIVVNDFINVDRALQDIALRYFIALLEHVNPYTGRAYKDDPGLAVVEFQNESNLFFHTLNDFAQGEPRLFARDMQQRFYRFIVKTYGTRDAVDAAWGGRWHAGDDWEGGRLALMGAFHWGRDGPLYEFKGHTRRAGDYIAFLTELQRNYYARREQELREAGFKGVTVSTAWRAGGPAASLANLYSDTAADMIDRHNYVGGGDGGHVIVEGKVSTMSHLGQPGQGLLSLGFFQIADKPFGISEWSMTPPAAFKAEAAPLVAYYGMGLQGWDASCHFACGSVRMGNGWPNMSKYVSHTPHYLGQFPALALSVHEGHIREAEPLAVRSMADRDVFSGRDSLGQALSAGGHDDKRLAGRPATPPATLAIGKVLVDFDGAPEPIPDLEPFWDRQARKLVSTTGELTWHYGARRIEIGSPRTQGLIGFAGAAPVRLPAVVTDVATPFVSLLFTSLDQRPLDQSGHILVTAMAREKQTGTRFNEDWSRLLAAGAPPLLMEPVQARIRIAGRRPAQVRPLDVYGVPTGKSVDISNDGSFAIHGAYQTYYYEIRR